MDWLNDEPWTDIQAYNYCSVFEYWAAMDEKDANWYNITATTALLYGLLTLLLNVRVYFVLLKNRKEEFSSSFYVVWIATNIVDSCWWVAHQFKDHVGTAPILHFVLEWIPNHGVFMTLWYFLIAYFMYADMFITVLLTLNRFINVIFKHEDTVQRIWKIVFPIGLLVVILLPIYFTWGIWYNWVVKCSYVTHGNSYFYINDILNGSWTAKGIQPDFGEFFVSFVCAIINAVLNLTTIISVVRQRTKFSHTSLKNASSHIKGPEVKMLVISCIMFINQCCYSAIHLIFFLSKFVSAVGFLVNPLWEVRRFVVDFMCLSPSWFLIIMIKSVRKRVIPGMTEIKNNKISTAGRSRTIASKLFRRVNT